MARNSGVQLGSVNGGDEDVARIEVGLSDVEDHASSFFDDSGGHRQSGQRALGQMLSPVDAADDLALGGEQRGGVSL